jgi:hypothetical protein
VFAYVPLGEVQSTYGIRSQSRSPGVGVHTMNLKGKILAERVVCHLLGAIDASEEPIV